MTPVPIPIATKAMATDKAVMAVIDPRPKSAIVDPSLQATPRSARYRGLLRRPDGARSAVRRQVSKAWLLPINNPRAGNSSKSSPSANARQLFADQHVDDPAATESGLHDDGARMGSRRPPDRNRIATGFMTAHGLECSIRLIARHE